MENPNYDEKIEDLLIKIEKQRESMALILEEFLNETEYVVSVFYKKQIKYFVVSKTDITLKHGKGNITNLKSKCRDLLIKMPDTVREKVDINKLWTHKWTINKLKRELNHNTYYGHKLKGKLIMSIYDTLTGLEDLLIKFNYITPKKDSFYFRDVGRFRWSPEMENIFNKYKESGENLVKLIEELKSVENEKRKTNAREIWENT